MDYFLLGGRLSALIVPVDTKGCSLSAIETQIIQVLARGRRASLNEARIVALLGASLADRSVTDWAEQFAARYRVSWSRRRHLGGLLFELLESSHSSE